MIIREIIEHQIRIDILLTVHCIVDLEIVLVVMRRPDALPAFVIRRGIEHIRIRKLCVVSVDQLAHEPAIGIAALDRMPDAAEEIVIDAVRGIEADAVDVELIHPADDRVLQIVDDIIIAQIQLDQLLAAVPRFIGERVAEAVGIAEPEIAEPAAIGGILPVAQDILKGEEASADMIEHAVHDDAEAVCMECIAEPCEILIRAESAVEHGVIIGIVAVCAGFPERAEIDGIDVHFFEMRGLDKTE